MTVRAYIGLGSNLGDRLANLQGVVERLSGRGIHPVRSSRVYETEPVGGPPQPPYLNAVIEVETDLQPRELLEAAHDVEASLGRVRGERWGPRTVDVDILTFDELEVDEPGLRIPHPRAHRRAFVLAPLLELDPDPVLADGRGPDRIRATGLGDVRVVAPPLVERI